MKGACLHFIASVEEDRVNEIQAIAGNLEKMGCTIENIFSFSGIITGSTDKPLTLQQLKIDGIKHVEKAREVRAL